MTLKTTQEQNDIASENPQVVESIKIIMEDALEDAVLPNFRIPVISKPESNGNESE